LCAARCVTVFCTLTSSVAEPRPADSIRRLDGSRITIQKADSFAKKTLQAAHVTGAQIAVLDGGRLVWSAAYGLRLREPDKKMHLHFHPGTQSRYSSEGINLVQFIIEQRKQRPLDQLMQDAIFAPLGMRRTGIIYQEEFEANVADRYDTESGFVRRRADSRLVRQDP
jgi:CubicO group peptidase (beta-lactamase class C family)